MWIYTTQGFLSVVQHNAMPDHFQIKARVPDPLQELWPNHEIEIIDWADYRYRITIEKSDALPVLLGLMEMVDYTSFKNACGGNRIYHTVLAEIWCIMYSYQNKMESLFNR